MTPFVMHPVGTVLVHPDDNLDNPNARRIMCRAVAPGEWPWMRITGTPRDLPRRFADLQHWQPQSLTDLDSVLRIPA